MDFRKSDARQAIRLSLTGAGNFPLLPQFVRHLFASPANNPSRRRMDPTFRQRPIGAGTPHANYWENVFHVARVLDWMAARKRDGELLGTACEVSRKVETLQRGVSSRSLVGHPGGCMKSALIAIAGMALLCPAAAHAADGQQILAQ